MAMAKALALLAFLPICPEGMIILHYLEWQGFVRRRSKKYVWSVTNIDCCIYQLSSSINMINISTL